MIRVVNDTRYPCSPSERSDPGDRGDKTTGYSIWLTPPPDFASVHAGYEV